MKNINFSEDYAWCKTIGRCTPPVMETRRHNVTTTIRPNTTEIDPIQQAEIDRAQERIDFYNTYDVMTGVRIAATLGGFFGLMVLLVVYKSKSKTEKALEDPKRNAAAVAEVEEEERVLAAALEATAYEQLNPSRRTRRSLDTTSVSPKWIRNTTRFSSVGGYSSLLEPPMRIPSRLPSSIDEDSPPENTLYDDIYDSCYANRHLAVPINRRPSNITCSSSASSYLERRGSSVILGLPAVPGHKTRTRRRQSSSPLPEHYDFYYPIDIRVIQPTPGGSPCGSERALYDNITPKANLKPRLAPLASISSCNSSLDYPDVDVHSYVSDSVFHDIECCEDTDDEVDPFSTDSDEDGTQPCCSKECQRRNRIRAEKMYLERIQHPLPTISDESTSTLIATSQGRELFQLPLANSASSTHITTDEHVWSQETLF